VIVDLTLVHRERSALGLMGTDPPRYAWSRAEHLLGCILRTELSGCQRIMAEQPWEQYPRANVLVSPASPVKAMSVWSFSDRVLSSAALRIVAPLIAALEAAMRVKSLPVMPRRTSLHSVLVNGSLLRVWKLYSHICYVVMGWCSSGTSNADSFTARL
jgi:hypothetical protein